MAVTRLVAAVEENLMHSFAKRTPYSRGQIRAEFGAGPGPGGPFDTGYHRVSREGNEVVIFSTLGEARTGHDYGDRWLTQDKVFHWRGKTGSRLGQPLIDFMLGPEARNHLFVRGDDRAPFYYAGLVRPIGAVDTVPVTVIWATDEIQGPVDPELLNEVVAPAFVEGRKQVQAATSFERSIAARQECIHHHGTNCAACGMSFEAAYGELGKGFIHVHHRNPLGAVAKEHHVDPRKDLVPVCPNCHAMIHRRNPPISVDDLQKLLQAAKTMRG